MSYQYFTDKELSCPCGCEGEMDSTFMKKLVTVRQEFNYPMKITSAYRCPTYNKSIGGVEGSAHTLGRAVDVSISGMPEDKQIDLLSLAIQFGIKGIGINDKKSHFIHMDDTRPRLWTY